MRNKTKKLRVCYVICYKDPFYTRTESLVNALKLIDGVELLVIRNKYRGWARYLEVPLRLIATRLKYRPDIFVVGFRAHEIFWALYPSMIRKKIIFDEFINLHDWLVSEHKVFQAEGIPIKIIDGYMRWVLGRAHFILSDTPAHAELTSHIYSIPPQKITPVPIGANEDLFYPRDAKKHKGFKVLFYGSMLPLHGVDFILDGLVELKRHGKLEDLSLTLAGGRGDKLVATKLENFARDNKLGSRLEHIEWIDYKKLPDYITGFDLVLGGPFGNTGQAKRVITGKTYQLLSMGKATVVGRIEGMQGFKDKENCLLVNQGSAKSISDALQWALGNRGKLKRIGLNGNKLFEENFSNRIIAMKLQRIIFSK